MFKRLAVPFALFACPLLAQAQNVAPYEEYATHLRAAQEVTPLTSGAFGDNVSLYNGATEFNVVDIDIPGNSALPVQLRRNFAVSDRRTEPGHLSGFAEWDLDVPYLEGVFSQQYGWVVDNGAGGYSYNRCSQPGMPYTGAGQLGYATADLVWDGYQMHMPGHGFQDLLVAPQSGVTDGKTYPWLTKDNTRLTCLSQTKNAPGEGFVAVSPDGTKTTFDFLYTKGYSSILVDVVNIPNYFGGGKGSKIYAGRSKVFILASKVEDRFGNWVKYNWSIGSNGNAILHGISSNDGRSIALTWTGGAITSVTSNAGTWKYGYTSNDSSTHYPGQQTLQTVTRPDLSTWTYASSGLLMSPIPDHDDTNPPPDHCQLDPIQPDTLASFTYGVTSPFGATASYQFKYDRHNRSYIPWSCADNNDYHYYPQIYDFVDNFTLESKTISGPGLAIGGQGQGTQTWNYTYGDGFGPNYFDATVSGRTTPWASQTYVPQGSCDPTNPCQLSKQVVVTGPTETTTYTFGVQYARNEGRLLATEVDTPDSNSPAGNTTLRTTTNTFVTDADVPNLPFPSYPGTNLSSGYKNPSANWTRPQSRTDIVQDGVTFTNQVNAWDVLARPTSVTRSNTLGYSKTETTAYADDTDIWVMGQVASVTDVASGKVMTQNTYDQLTAMPASTSSFGLLQKTFTYQPADPVNHNDQAGTLATVSDGLGQTTTLSDWKLGVPRTVAYADGTSEKAAVDDTGWISSLTDENGYTTGYQYDAMGRVTEVDYPGNDSVAWTPTTSSFVQVSASEYGLDPGHWKRTVSTGNAKKTTYYDALLRPVLQREEDTGNAATVRYTEQAFDAANRTTFAAYPVATVTNYNDALTGTNTAYDGLGRITTVKQDSELGTAPLKTSYAYLSGFQTKVTNPRLYATTTAYQAFDTPDTSHPVSIASPANVTTTIARDVFGKPLSIKRSGFWNGLAINETRTYVYDGNQRLCMRVEPEAGANLIAYDAANNVSWTSPGNAPTSSCTSTPPANAIAYTYDQRNRPLTESIPGSTPIAWSYYPDGALQTLTSGSGGTANTWSYTYNKRRLPVTEQLTIDGRLETISHAYNVLGNETSLTYPSGFLLGFAPNALGQPTKAAASATGVTYFPNGGMSGFTYGNGIVHTLTQNTRGLPLRSLDQSPSAPAILDDTYAYDENANVASITDGTNSGANNRSMSYDGLDRLTSTSAPNQWWISATTSYDALDNIRTNQVGNVASYLNTYTYDPATWHVTAVAGHANWTLGYDVNGNITGKGAGKDSYVFDVANRMQSVTGKESYVYDGYGRRVKVTRTSDGKIDYPVYDMTGRLITEDDQRSNKTIDYLSLNGSLIAKRGAPLGGTTYTLTYEHTDALHSPTYETNAAGSLTRVERYTPFGEPSDGTYSQGPGFTGHVTDAATGLTYAQQRYYDPVLGRFLSTDPVLADNKGGSFNRYWYANDNPYRFTDRDGRCVEDFCIGEGILTCLASAPCTGAVVALGAYGAYAAKKATDGLRALANASHNEAHEDAPKSDETPPAPQGGSGAKESPPLPNGLVGDQTDPKAGSNKSGNRHTSGPLKPEHGGTGDYEKDLETLTGGTRPQQPGDRAPPGSQVGANGIFGRPINSSGGKSIDIPANGDKPHETLHY